MSNCFLCIIFLKLSTRKKGLGSRMYDESIIASAGVYYATPIAEILQQRGCDAPFLVPAFPVPMPTAGAANRLRGAARSGGDRYAAYNGTRCVRGRAAFAPLKPARSPGKRSTTIVLRRRTINFVSDTRVPIAYRFLQCSPD